MLIDISIDILIDILTDIFIDISIDIFIDILTDIFIDMFIDISIDIFIDILTYILTDKEEGGGRKEGVDFFLKSKNPNLKGGQKKRTQQVTNRGDQNAFDAQGH